MTSAITDFIPLFTEATIASWCVHTLASDLAIVGVVVTLVHV